MKAYVYKYKGKYWDGENWRRLRSALLFSSKKEFKDDYTKYWYDLKGTLVKVNIEEIK